MSLVAGTATLSVSPGQPLPATNAAQAAISVVVTDAAGTVSPPVTLTGAESPPWTYAATYAEGPASFVATAIDVNSAAIGSPVSGSFSVTAKVVPTFTAPVSLAFAAS